LTPPLKQSLWPNVELWSNSLAKFHQQIWWKIKKFKNKTILDISIVKTKFKEMFFLPNSHIWFQNNQKWLNLPMDNHHFDYVTKSIKWNSVNYNKYIIQQKYIWVVGPIFLLTDWLSCEAAGWGSNPFCWGFHARHIHHLLKSLTINWSEVNFHADTSCILDLRHRAIWSDVLLQEKGVKFFKENGENIVISLIDLALVPC
jgi:hypothetical protein